jgi:uncharacterized protein YndB with AHSA1/START domain
MSNNVNKDNLEVDRTARVISMSRVFNAPRELVWKAYTDPDLVPKWWGPRYLTTVVDKMDFIVGGVWRFIQKDAQGNVYAFNGVFREIKAPELLCYTFEFEPMAGHISVDTIIFEALANGKTKITATTIFNTLEDLEGMLQSGMEGGAVESWDRLAELLEAVRT